jgi:hypothetical protein
MTHTIPLNNPLSPVSMRATANSPWPKAEPSWFAAASLELANAFKELEEALPFDAGFIAQENAPSSYKELRENMRWAINEGIAYPVWSGESDNTIYPTPTDNHRFRFAHDYYHYLLAKEFTPQGEMYVHEYIEQLLKDLGVSALARALYLADSEGQTKYHEAIGQFPVNQRQFAIDTVTNGYLKG